MCNFYSRHRPPGDFKEAFRFPETPNLEPRFVVRPTDTEGVVAIGKDGGRHFVPMRWGLVPYWAKNQKTGLTLFNARSETMLQKNTFSEPFAKGRRCLVPVDGFFEFTGPRGAKQAHLFKPRDDRVMAFAGLWESWRGPIGAPLAEPLLSYTIATTAPNATVSPVHDRMPVLFTAPEQWDAWLDPETPAERLIALLAPAPDDLLETFMVSRELLRLKELNESILQPV